MCASDDLKTGLSGLRVLSLESRRADQMAKLIEHHGGIALVAPSMRETPLTENPAALSFADELFAGRIDVVIFLTGVGTRILFGAVETKYPRERLVTSLSSVQVVARGPKPVAVLREFGVPVTVIVPEPNTWRDILRVLDEGGDERQTSLRVKGKRVALQEYGVSNRELIQGLEARGAIIIQVPVYQWALPEDIGPLQHATREIAGGKIDVLMITSAVQVSNLMEVASRNGLAKAVVRSLKGTVVASIGPISSEALLAHDIVPDMEPVHPKMGQLVHEIASKARALLEKKRGLIKKS